MAEVDCRQLGVAHRVGIEPLIVCQLGDAEPSMVGNVFTKSGVAIDEDVVADVEV